MDYRIHDVECVGLVIVRHHRANVPRRTTIVCHRTVSFPLSSGDDARDRTTMHDHHTTVVRDRMMSYGCRALFTIDYYIIALCNEISILILLGLFHC